MKQADDTRKIGVAGSSRWWQAALLLVIVIAIVGIVFIGRPDSGGAAIIKPGEGMHGQQWRDLDGMPVAEDAYAGQPMLVNVWASWCKACVNELPLLEAASGILQDVNLVALNFEESAAIVNPYINRYDLSLKVLLDETGSLRQMYPVRELPLTLLFDAEGRYVDKRIGAFAEVADIAAFVKLAQP